MAAGKCQGPGLPAAFVASAGWASGLPGPLRQAAGESHSSPVLLAPGLSSVSAGTAGTQGLWQDEKMRAVNPRLLAWKGRLPAALQEKLVLT